MILGHLDPDPGPLVRGMDPNPDPDTLFSGMDPRIRGPDPYQNVMYPQHCYLTDLYRFELFAELTFYETWAKPLRFESWVRR
jgi:hypothetical protein